MSQLWGVSISDKKEASVEVPEDRDLIVTRAALVGSSAGANVLSIKNGEQTLVLGTLRSAAVEQFELDLNVCAGSTFSFLMTGPNEIHLTGYYNMVYADSDDTDSYEGPFDLAGYSSQSDDDFAGSGEDESSDESMEEDGVTPSPMKPGPKTDKRKAPQAPGLPAKKQRTELGALPTQATPTTPPSAKKKTGTDITKPAKGGKQETTPKKTEEPKKEEAKKDEPKETTTPPPKQEKKGAKKVGGQKAGGAAAPKGKEAGGKPQEQKGPAKKKQGGGEFACTACSKKFNTDQARLQHTAQAHKK